MSAEKLILDCALQAENKRLRDELTAMTLERDRLARELRTVEAQLMADNGNLCRILERTRDALVACQLEQDLSNTRIAELVDSIKRGN